MNLYELVNKIERIQELRSFRRLTKREQDELFSLENEEVVTNKVNSKLSVTYLDNPDE